ncbi:3'-5' exonuclease [Anaeromyxobacter sp. Fw109-5]|uniref:3'-5' exonuclease n=1 Tax=Anaeromyxobacter sp. (strain Fw109-5) TaxID=404589 RepID=UPI00059C4F58|nr:3'-5' exonuclease [Anaeromyxobacter sp. Fw109-5]
MRFRSPPWDSLVYWAIDVETGGLDAKRDPLLAIGMVPVRAGRIRLGECYRTLVRPHAGTRITSASVTAHQLVSNDFEAAPPLGDVLPEVERRAREGALLFHHAAIDVAFLRRDFARTGLTWPSCPVVDTARLLVRHAQLRDPTRPRDHIALNLSVARAELGLPEYQAHDALSDAIATAELFLALRMALGARTLRDLR